MHTRSSTGLEEDEGKIVPGRTEKESAKRSGQNRPVERTGQSTDVGGSWRSRKAAARTCELRCWVGQREKMSQHSFVALWEFRSKYTRAIACLCTESYTKVSQTSPFLRFEQTQVRVCLFSFLPPSWLCMLCFVCP